MKNNHIDFDSKKLYAIYALQWCKDILGKSIRKKREIKITFSSKKLRNNRNIFFGKYCYCRNLITLYPNNCETFLCIVETVIHEYTHYLQPSTQYFKVKYSYKSNPFEIEAQKNEKKFGKICLRDIKNQLKISNSGISFK
jgi:hypothetical protein